MKRSQPPTTRFAGAAQLRTPCAPFTDLPRPASKRERIPLSAKRFRVTQTRPSALATLLAVHARPDQVAALQKQSP